MNGQKNDSEMKAKSKQTKRKLVKDITSLPRINSKSISDLNAETQNYKTRRYHRRNLHDLGMAMTS